MWSLFLHSVNIIIMRFVSWWWWQSTFPQRLPEKRSGASSHTQLTRFPVHCGRCFTVVKQWHKHGNRSWWRNLLCSRGKVKWSQSHRTPQSTLGPNRMSWMPLLILSGPGAPLVFITRSDCDESQGQSRRWGSNSCYLSPSLFSATRFFFCFVFFVTGHQAAH